MSYHVRCKQLLTLSSREPVLNDMFFTTNMRIRTILMTFDEQNLTFVSDPNKLFMKKNIKCSGNLTFYPSFSWCCLRIES